MIYKKTVGFYSSPYMNTWHIFNSLYIQIHDLIWNEAYREFFVDGPITVLELNYFNEDSSGYTFHYRNSITITALPRLAAPANEIGPLVPAVLLVVW